MHDFYLVHTLKREEQHYRLLPKERDHDSYLSIVNGKDNATGRVANALAFFEEQLTIASKDNPGALRDIFNAVTGRLEFMCATLEAENAYNIFKSLNSTGVPLGSSDLIRNFVFMHVLPDEHDEFDRDSWRPVEAHFAREDGTLDEDAFSRFFRDFLMSAGRYVSPKETFSTFEARYEATNFSPVRLAEELSNAVTAYAVIRGEKRDSNTPVAMALAGLNQLDSSTTYPLLLTLFRRRADGIIDDATLARCIEMLRGFILRRFICGETSRGYGQMFVRALAQDVGDVATTLERYLIERGWPDDRKFQTHFLHFPLYQKDYARAILESLERARGHKEEVNLESSQIEHIMPQTLNAVWTGDLGNDSARIHGEWLHRPGNLTLSAYNPELWNHPFPIKRAKYLESNIGMTRELGLQPTWGEEEMRQRGHALAVAASVIWVGPKQPPAATKGGEGENGPGRRELRSSFWQGLSDYFAAEHPDLPSIESLPNSTIRLPSGVRHIGIELHLSLRQQQVGVDIWFWRAASRHIWSAIQPAPLAWEELAGQPWEFEHIAGQERARMSLIRRTDPRDEASWPELHRWMGEKLAVVYKEAIPKLRLAMETGAIES